MTRSTPDDPAAVDWEAFYRGYRAPGFVPGYDITSKLGGGMFGLVFRASKQSIGKDYAIKFLKVDDDEVRQAVLAELESVRHFAQVDHPNLVSIEDRGEVVGIPYIVMAYAGDQTLRDLLAAGAEPAVLLGYFLQACRGVGALHDRGLVHFDLKPANIFIRGAVARVGDYGLSKLVAHSRNSLSMGRGTPTYMAPEMLQRRGDARSDIYSLGIILFECLTGDVPFKGESEWEVLRKHETAPLELPAALPPESRAILERCLAKDPADRYASAAELLAALLDERVAGLADQVAPAPARRAEGEQRPPEDGQPAEGPGSGDDEDRFADLRSAARAFGQQARAVAVETAKAARVAVSDRKVHEAWRKLGRVSRQHLGAACARARRELHRLRGRCAPARLRLLHGLRGLRGPRGPHGRHGPHGVHPLRWPWRPDWSGLKRRALRTAGVALVAAVLVAAMLALLVARGPVVRVVHGPGVAAPRPTASASSRAPSLDWLQLARAGDPRWQSALRERLARFAAARRAAAAGGGTAAAGVTVESGGAEIEVDSVRDAVAVIAGVLADGPERRDARVEAAIQAARALAGSGRYDAERAEQLRQAGRAGVLAALRELRACDVRDPASLRAAAHLHRFLQEQLRYDAIHLEVGPPARDPAVQAANARVAPLWTEFVAVFAPDDEAYSLYLGARR